MMGKALYWIESSVEAFEIAASTHGYDSVSIFHVGVKGWVEDHFSV